MKHLHLIELLTYLDIWTIFSFTMFTGILLTSQCSIHWIPVWFKYTEFLFVLNLKNWFANILFRISASMFMRKHLIYNSLMGETHNMKNTVLDQPH